MEKIVKDEDELNIKRSLVETRDFLSFLIKYENLPEFVRLDARYLLEQFPTDYTLIRIFNK